MAISPPLFKKAFRAQQDEASRSVCPKPARRSEWRRRISESRRDPDSHFQVQFMVPPACAASVKICTLTPILVTNSHASGRSAAKIAAQWRIRPPLLYHHRFATRIEARTAILDYIETFYNRTQVALQS